MFLPLFSVAFDKHRMSKSLAIETCQYSGAGNKEGSPTHHRVSCSYLFQFQLRSVGMQHLYVSNFYFSHSRVLTSCSCTLSLTVGLMMTS